MTSGDTSGVFLRCCSWYDSSVLTANRWQRKALPASVFYYPEGVNLCNLLRNTSCRITSRSWITSSHPRGWVGCIGRRAVAWEDLRRVLRSAVKWWQCVYSHLDLFQGSNVWMWLSICIHTHYQATGSSLLQKTSAEQFVCCCAAEHVTAASV